MFIGQWVEASERRERHILNPFNQEVIAIVAEGSKEDAERAIAVAREAFDEGTWPHMSGYDRSKLINRIAALVEKHCDELAILETLNTGKTLIESKADMNDIADVFRYYASLANKDERVFIDSPIKNTSSQIRREPVGVCALITPWNYPLLQASWKLAPALAAGNTVVLKPSELTPLTSLKMMELIEEAGIPSGVINVVTGSGATVGSTLAASMDVDFISFTGGGETGRKILGYAASNFKKIALELGGKNPNVVFADCDFETALDYALNAVFFHAGQVCSAGTRLIIEESLHDRFVAALVDRVKSIKLGSGMDDETEMGPLISAEHLHKVEKYIEIGKREGATLLVGGKGPEDKALAQGFFILPTIFDHCSANMRIVQEETFGPILTVETFQTEAEAIRLANDSVYGLAGAVWTKDMKRAERVSRAFRMGTVWINDFHPYFAQAPWGGYKQSGIGRELGKVGLEEYTEIKHIFQNDHPQPMKWFGNQLKGEE
ncbi:betaine-aldehyde dehydrogenase [Bacillus chungangensis]|nr:betaine-aldehyde dehydrogenase [Bacillus chungangensis]